MDPSFSTFRFSTHFNRLTYLGMWPAAMLTDKTVKRLWNINRVFWYLLYLTVMVLQAMDFYFALGNLRKVTFNLCTSIIGVAYPIKIYFLYSRRDSLNELRRLLWQDSIKYNCEEDVALQDVAYSKLRKIHRLFYIACFTFLPTLVASSYFGYHWGVRELPFAMYIPMSDPYNDFTFVPALLYETVCAFYIIFIVIEEELSIFSLIFQLIAHYSILIKNINKINEIYVEDEDVEEQKRLKIRIRKADSINEVNEYLKRRRAKTLLKNSVIRHLELIYYTEIFEYVFSRCLFLQILGGAALIVMNSIELSLYMHEISIRLCFQTAFVAVTMLDIWLLCHYLSIISEKCVDVANTLYSSVWYKMDLATRKDLSIIMILSRKPPRVTAGKLFLMDLNTYLHLLRNIYSWLMLMRQVMEK